MDLRVLVAVFITLFGIAIGMADGDLTQQELMDKIEDLQNPQQVETPQVGNWFDLLDTRKAPNTTINAELLSDETVTIELKDRTTVLLTVTPDAQITAYRTQLQPQEQTSVVLDGFSGTITVSDTMRIKGTMRLIDTEMLTLNYSRTRPVTITEGAVQNITIPSLDRQTMSFEAASGKITAGSGNSELRADNQAVTFQSYSGPLTITRPFDATQYSVDGKVFKATVGSEYMIGGK